MEQPKLFDPGERGIDHRGRRPVRRFAVKRVRGVVADDIAQYVALDCVLKGPAGKWAVAPAKLEGYVSRVVGRRVANWGRWRRHSAERNAEHLRDLSDSVHSWISPDLAFEERELTELDRFLR